MVDKLSRLPDRTQDVLKLLACLGNTAETVTLALVRDEPEAAIDSHLWEAVRIGLVFRLDQKYAFLHDRIQEAAYSLIPANQRAAVRLKIGRSLLAAMSDEKLAEQIFDVVNQFSHGAALITDPYEIERVAGLNLRAGRKAKASTGYASASHYFSAGLALIGPSGWATYPDLAFGLTIEFAECSYLSSSFDEADRLVTDLLQKATSKVDKAAAYRLKVELHVVKSEPFQAVACALEGLRLFDIDMLPQPSQQEVHAEYAAIWRNLEDRSIESLIDLPKATVPEPIAAMRLLAALMPPAYQTDINLYYLVLCRMTDLSLTYGITESSAHGIGLFGWALCHAFRRYDDGYRFGKLALELVEKRGYCTAPGRVYFAMGLIAVWTNPLSASTQLFRTAFQESIEAGDLFYATSSACRVIMDLILTGVALDEVWRDSQLFLDSVRKSGFRDGIDLIVSQSRFVAAMRGQTASLSTFSGADFDESAFEAALTADRMPAMVLRYWILKLKARFMAGDYTGALAAVDKAKTPVSPASVHIWASSVHIQLLDYFYYTALALAALYETASADEQSRWNKLLASHQEQLREWAERYPPTFADKHTLVSAEIARLEGRELDAERLYEQAIQLARDNSFVQNEGLAHELAARFYAARGFATIANAYLRNAHHCYLRWGALGKVRQLDELYPQIREPEPSTGPMSTIGAPVESLDLATVIRVSQAVSGEIVLEKLIDTLMRTSIEQAGAERGLLLLPRGGDLRIEAEATTAGDTVIVHLRDEAVAEAALPESLLHYVLRTRQSVILDDAAAQSAFAEDPYIHERQARSILCLPLISQDAQWRALP